MTETRPAIKSAAGGQTGAGRDDGLIADPETQAVPDEQAQVARLAELFVETRTAAERRLTVSAARLKAAGRVLNKKTRQSASLIEELAASLTESGRLLIRDGRLEEAAARFKRAARLKPSDPKTCALLGGGFFMLGDSAAAMPLLRQSAAARPDDETVHRQLAALLTAAGERDESQALMTGFFNANPVRHRPAARVSEGRVLIARGLNGTFYTTGTDRKGLTVSKRCGGHFATRHLFDHRAYDVDTITLTAGGLEAPERLPEADVILNVMADPDAEGGPLGWLAGAVSGLQHTPVLNRPERVLDTGRDGNYRRLLGLSRDGIEFPRTERLVRGERTSEEMVDALEELNLGWPVVLRRTGAWTAIGAEKVADRRAAEAYFEKTQGDAFYVIEYIDFRIDGTHYNKKRVFCIDGALYPVVSHIDTEWNVRGHHRLDVMAKNAWMTDQEQAFLKNPKNHLGAEAYGRLEKVAATAGLDFFGIDFVDRPDGSVLVYALNSAMYESFGHARQFPYMVPHMRAISEAFTAMLENRIGG